MYCAIIGDIINSKRQNMRLEIQRNLMSILNKLNETFGDEIASNFIITLGDEFQGLLKKPEKLFEIIESINDEMYPVRIRFGIGFGDIDTEINRLMSIGADGPAYHNARKMIEEIKKEGKSKKEKIMDVKISSEAADGDYSLYEDDIINVALSLCSFVEMKWTQRQREIISDYIKSGDNQRKVAERMGVTQSSIQRGLKNSGFYNYLYARKEVQGILTSKWHG